MSTRTLKFVWAISLLLIAFGIGCATYVWLSSVETDAFNAAMQRRDWSKARKIWNRGLVRQSGEAFPQFMGILDELEKGKIVQVKDCEIRRSMITNEYTAVMLIKTEDGEGQVLLRWESNGWRLFSNHEFVPPELRQILAERKRRLR